MLATRRGQDLHGRTPASRSSARRRPSSARSSARRSDLLGDGHPRNRREDRLKRAAMNDTANRPASSTGPASSTDAARATCACSCGRSSSARPTASRRCCSCTARRWRRSRRSTSPCPGGRDSSVMDWFARARLRLLVRRHGRLRALATSTRDIYCDIANGADDLAAATDYIAAARGVTQLHDLRHLVGRAARGAVRAAPSASAWRGSRSTRSSGPAKARRRSSSGARSCREFLAAQAPADRPRVRPFDLRARPSGLRRPARRRRVRRRDPRARRLDAQRHLHRHVLASCRSSIRAQITMPTLVLRGQYDGIAGVRRPDRVLQAAAATPTSSSR